METTVKLKLGFAALMIVSGIGVAMYPVVSNAVAQRHASSVIESYNDNVQSMDAEKIDAAKEAARRYNQQLNNAIDRDAAGEADDIGTSYVDMLDVGESLGYITIPKIDVNLPHEGGGENAGGAYSNWMIWLENNALWAGCLLIAAVIGCMLIWRRHRKD